MRLGRLVGRIRGAVGWWQVPRLLSSHRSPSCCFCVQYVCVCFFFNHSFSFFYGFLFRTPFFYFTFTLTPPVLTLFIYLFICYDYYYEYYFFFFLFGKGGNLFFSSIPNTASPFFISRPTIVRANNLKPWQTVTMEFSYGSAPPLLRKM